MSQNPYASPEPVRADQQTPAWSSSAAPAPAPAQNEPWGSPAGTPSASSAAPAPSAPAASRPAATAAPTSSYPSASSTLGTGSNYGSNSSGSAAGTSGTSASAKGFFGAIFDFSFRHFVTIRFVQIFYIIGIAWALLNYLGGFITFGVAGAAIDPWGDYSAWPIVLYILFGWIVPIVMILALRVGLEFVVATIRTSQNTTEIADQLKARG